MNSKREKELKIFSEGFNIQEIEEIKESFSEIVPVERRSFRTDSAEILPTVLIFSIGFVLGSIAQGFFKAIGSELYKTAKEKVIQKLKNKQNPTLKFEMSYKNTMISVVSQTNDEKELNKVFDTIGKARDLAIIELDKKEASEMTEMTIHYENGWIPQYKLKSGQVLHDCSVSKKVMADREN